MKRQIISLFVFLLFSILIFPSCASIVNGGRQEVTITTLPPGATITILDTTVIHHVTEDSIWDVRNTSPITGTSPMKAILTRGEHHIIEIKRDGYKTEHIVTGNGTAGWYWGNLLIGGILGDLIDIGSGAAYSVEPSNLDVSLGRGTGISDKIVYQNSTEGVWLAPLLLAVLAVVGAVAIVNLSHNIYY